jgi:hypothetical protein
VTLIGAGRAELRHEGIGAGRIGIAFLAILVVVAGESGTAKAENY